MTKLKLLAIAFFVFAASAAYADQLITFTAFTSSISGTTGSIDFQFNGGPLVNQPATLQILDFSTDGTLVGAPTLTDDVSGALPGAVTFDNGTSYNDYFQDFTFGNTLSFLLDFSGPAINSPNGTATSGSSFAFSMFSDAAGTVPVLTNDPNGYAATVAVNLDGTITPATPSPEVYVTPEPGTLCLLGSGFAAFGSRFRRRRR